MVTIRPSNQPVPVAQTDALDASLAGHKELVRSHLDLGPGDVILISALSCTGPDCPPVETVVVVLDEGHRKWTFPLPPHELTADILRQHITASPQGHLRHD